MTAPAILPVSALSPNDYNPNRMTDDGFVELVAEIRHLGRLPKPMVARPNGDGGYIIIDGEHAWRAAQEAGLTEIAVEVVNIDYFEARRQTFKRNQHGEHDPVLLGRMFREMMDDRELSQRGLAKEIGISEGTVRNATLFVEAAELRNSYALAAGLEETTEASAALVSALSVRQIRYYNRLPHMLGGMWLAAGADLRALLNVKTDDAIAATEQETDAPANVGRYFKGLEATGLFEFVSRPWCGDGFARNLKTIEAWDKWERGWTWGLNENRLSIKQLRPYTRHYFKGVFYVRDEMMIGNALNLIINTQTQPPSFHLTPEEFEAVIAECELVGRESAQGFQARLELLVRDKCGGAIPKGKHGVRWELMQHAIDVEAPDYIRDSKLPIEHRYLLWKASGDEAAKRRTAQERYLPGESDDIKKRVAESIEMADEDIRREKMRKKHIDRYSNSTRLELATSLAGRLFGKGYKDNPDALTRVAARLARLEKAEILALDDFIADEKRFWDRVANISALAGAI